jgi:hypothetical protein
MISDIEFKRTTYYECNLTELQEQFFLQIIEDESDEVKINLWYDVRNDIRFSEVLSNFLSKQAYKKLLTEKVLSKLNDIHTSMGVNIFYDELRDDINKKCYGFCVQCNVKKCIIEGTTDTYNIDMNIVNEKMMLAHSGLFRIIFSIDLDKDYKTLMFKDSIKYYLISFSKLVLALFTVFGTLKAFNVI